MRSMRATLLWLLLGALAVVMAAAGLLSYRAGLQEAGEMFDARLVQSTRVLVSLVDEPLSELNAFPGEPIVLRGWHGQAHGVGEALAFNDGHAYENKLAFQVWDAQGRLLLRSDSAPARPLATLKAGYEDVVVDGAHWRAFTLRSPNGRWFQSAELTDIREELAGDIAGGTLLPLLLSLPLIALLVWWSVALATRSLRRMSHEIGQRDPERMTPLEVRQIITEGRATMPAFGGRLGAAERLCRGDGRRIYRLGRWRAAAVCGADDPRLGLRSWPCGCLDPSPARCRSGGDCGRVRPVPRPCAWRGIGHGGGTGLCPADRAAGTQFAAAAALRADDAGPDGLHGRYQPDVHRHRLDCRWQGAQWARPVVADAAAAGVGDLDRFWRHR